MYSGNKSTIITEIFHLTTVTENRCGNTVQYLTGRSINKTSVTVLHVYFQILVDLHVRLEPQFYVRQMNQ